MVCGCLDETKVELAGLKAYVVELNNIVAEIDKGVSGDRLDGHDYGFPTFVDGVLVADEVVTVATLQQKIADLYNHSGANKGFLKSFLYDLNNEMKFFQVINYSMTLFDLVDGGLDFATVAELAAHRKTVPHAVWLAITTTLSLGIELWLKNWLWEEQGKATRSGMALSLKNTMGRPAFIMLCAMLELVVFYVEDSTTLFIFWQTGLAGSSAGSAIKANLYFSIASVAIALIGQSTSLECA